MAYGDMEIINEFAETLDDELVAHHVREYAVVRRDGSLWLPSEPSEADQDLERRLRARFGRGSSVGPLSEEWGWLLASV